MNTYKLNNIIKKELLKKFDNSQISKKQFSFALLNQLCNNYPIIEYIYENYCCHGEDKCCWIDEETCWMKYSLQKDVNKTVYKRIKKGLKDKRFKNSIINISKRNVFIGENDKVIFYCIPLRDKTKYDIWIVFDKEHTFEYYDK